MKKILLSLFGIITLGFISFCSAGQVVDILDIININQTSLTNGVWTDLVDFGNSRDSYTVCFRYDGYVGDLQTGIGTFSSEAPGTNFYYWHDWYGKYVCFYKSPNDRYLIVKSDRNTMIYGDYFIFDDLLDYDIDTNYCLSNNLCPGSTFYLNDINSLNFPAGYTYNINYSDNVSFDYEDLVDEVNFNFSSSVNSSGFSNVYIYSDNQYTPLNSASNIFVNLPSYVGYNYGYSNGGNDLDITIGYSVDTGYIDGIITTQNYKPTSDDFTELIGTLTPYSKILIFCLFMFIIWAWIKKPFKSKRI